MTPGEFLGNHTYLMVLVGASVIGLVSGALGSFAYLRKQSLISDVISHAALPGALAAFLVLAGLGADGRSMVGLVVGAVAVGMLAVLAANHVTRVTRLRIDTTMATALAVFFGAGMLLMRVISDGTLPGKGGIQDYLFGNASVITVADLVTIGAVGATVLVLMLLCFKEFELRTFDGAHATLLGFGPRTLDALMFGAIVVATVIGVKAVGLVLMVALVVTPPAAARQWTRRLPTMVALAGAIGAVGSGTGAYLSVALGPVPPGPLIVLVLFGILVASLLFAPARSVITRAAARARTRRVLLRELEAEAALRGAA